MKRSKTIRIAIIFTALMVVSSFTPQTFAQEGVSTTVVTAQARKGFGPAFRKAIRQGVRDGKISRADALKLNSASWSPGFRKRAQDIILIELATSGDDVPEGLLTNGVLDRASIDWDKLLAFLKEFLPILLEFLIGLGLGV